MVTKDTFDKLTSVAGDVYSSKFFIYDVPNQELSKVQAIARQMVEFHGCDILFIDYLQKIRVQSKEERRDRVAQASTALKDLSRQLDIPVVAAAQLRRDVDGRQPHLGDFSDSSEIEKDADVAILLHRDDEEEDMVWAIVAKNRDGQKGRVKLRFNRAFVRFDEVDSHDM
jgi:replicative DNA helicase